jgi:hypothetical protein
VLGSSEISTKPGTGDPAEDAKNVRIHYRHSLAELETTDRGCDIETDSGQRQQCFHAVWNFPSESIYQHACEIFQCGSALSLQSERCQDIHQRRFTYSRELFGSMKAAYQGWPDSGDIFGLRLL